MQSETNQTRQKNKYMQSNFQRSRKETMQSDTQVQSKKNQSPLVKGERLVRLEVNAAMQEQSELLSTGGKAEDGNSLTS